MWCFNASLFLMENIWLPADAVTSVLGRPECAGTVPCSAAVAAPLLAPLCLFGFILPAAHIAVMD